MYNIIFRFLQLTEGGWWEAYNMYNVTISWFQHLISQNDIFFVYLKKQKKQRVLGHLTFKWMK